MRPRLRAFDPIDISPGSRVFVVGPRNCGKSTLVRDIIRDIGVRDLNVVTFSGHLRESGRPNLIADPTAADLAEIAARLTEPAAERPPSAIFFDDLHWAAGDPRVTALQEILVSAKSAQVTVFVATQTTLPFAGNLRHFADFVFAMPHPSKPERRRLREDFFQYMEGDAEFWAALGKVGEERGALVVEIRSFGAGVRRIYSRYSPTPAGTRIKGGLPIKTLTA